MYSLNLDTLDAPDEVKEFILNNKRGAGFWCWKAFALKQILKLSNPNDIIIYVDSGTYFNKSIENIREFINENDLLVFQHSGHYEQLEYTKMNAVKYFGYSGDWCKTEGKQNQLMAAFIGIKNNRNGVLLIDEWLISLSPGNSKLFNDDPSDIPNCDGFIESRHDQQMLSLIIYKYFDDILFPKYDKGLYGWVWHEKINGKNRNE